MPGVEEFDFEDYGSRMVPSQILTLGRIWSYRQERRILSKYEAGGWTAIRLPDRYRPVMEQALEAWYGGGELPPSPGGAGGLRRFLIRQITE